MVAPIILIGISKKDFNWIVIGFQKSMLCNKIIGMCKYPPFFACFKCDNDTSPTKKNS